MNINEGVLIALVAVLIIIVVMQGRSAAGASAKSPEKFSGDAHIVPDGGVISPDTASLTNTPYAVLQAQDGAIRGARHDAYNQDHAYLYADLAKNYRNWATTPRDIEEAQRAAWFEATSAGDNAYYNIDALQKGTAGAETVEHHTPGPAINYQDTLVDLVADPRMRVQQANWYSEVAPKSQTSLKVDTIDEAAAISNQRGHGIYAFRFPAPSQHNPLFITDQDAESYGVNTTRFAFGG